MIGVATLLAVLVIALVITRIATVALRATGLSHEAARFQARSAFSGVGFTTTESEDIVNHPVRRNIVLMLMALSTAGVVTTVATLLLSFADTSGFRQAAIRLTALLLGLLALWALAASPTVERAMSRVIEWALTRWTDIDTRDYVRLLDISGPYTITEIRVDPGEWLEGALVGDLDLAEEGVVVLGIRHPDGRYVGAPTITTPIRAGDLVVVYGRAGALEELRDRKAGISGDRAHDRAVVEQRRIVAAQTEVDRPHGNHREHAQEVDR